MRKLPVLQVLTPKPLSQPKKELIWSRAKSARLRATKKLPLPNSSEEWQVNRLIVAEKSQNKLFIKIMHKNQHATQPVETKFILKETKKLVTGKVLFLWPHSLSNYHWCNPNQSIAVFLLLTTKYIALAGNFTIERRTGTFTYQLNVLSSLEGLRNS